jgi:hypothetical protein
MGDASAESFEHMFGGLEALLVSGAPLAEKRDGLGFEDHMVSFAPSTLPGNGEIAYVGDDGAAQCISAGNSASVNTLQGLTAPEKQRGSVERQIAGRRRHTRVSVSASGSAAYVDARGTSELPALAEGMHPRNHKSLGNARIVVSKGTAGPLARSLR